MIKFVRVYCQNFMSVGNDGMTFDYKTGLFYCYGVNHDVSSDIDGTPISNGSGKTVCLVDAPLFALFGRTQRNINKSEIINLQNGSDCVVKLTFLKGDVEYVIERGLKPDKILIYKNGEAEKEEAKKREANRIIIDDLLDGISFEVFKNLVVLNGTSSKHFFEYGRNEKRVFINEVFKLGFLDYLQDNLTEEVKDKKTKLEKLEILKETKEKEIERLTGLFEAHESGDVVDMCLEDLQTILAKEIEKRNTLSERLSFISTVSTNGDLDAYKSLYDTALEKYDKEDKDKLKIDFSISELNKQVAKLRNDWMRVTAQSICNHCTQPIPESLKNKLQIEIKDAATKIKDELKTLTDTRTSKTTSLFNMKTWIDNAKTIITEYETKMVELDHSDKIIKQYESQIKSKIDNPLNSDKIRDEINNATGELTALVDEYNNVQRDYSLHKICRDIVSDKNFYGYYISVFRKYLNQTINLYLTKMASPHTIKFNNDLEAEVSNGNLNIASYASLSTGEKSKINLALLLSFFDVLHSFHRMRTSILVLDEILDTGIDGEGIKLLNLILKEKISENKDLGIYVVSHKSVETSWDKQEGLSRVVFEKRNGFTSYKGD
jgi:DNA repair exonuclease SbcCD ATPase subunit